MTDELATRFSKVGRGRNVRVKFEPTDFILECDYRVAYDPETDIFEVQLRHGGCFEGAYRCIERFIEAKAEELDAVSNVPAGNSDVRKWMYYWIIEKAYNQFYEDLQSAVEDKVGWLRQDRPGEDVVGEVSIEARSLAMEGLLAHLAPINAEVRSGILSSTTLRFLKHIGLDLIPKQDLYGTAPESH